MKWIEQVCPQRNPGFKKNAEARQGQLTKPPGSLGKLEQLAIRLADLQQSNQPQVDKIAISVFAADHGVAEEGVSAFPQEVTAQMVMNFINGGAAISVMAKQLDACMEVIDVGMLEALPGQEGLIVQRAANGTANSSKQDAMTAQQLATALQAGFDSVERALKRGADLFIGGEMGIGNTTAASALYCALLGLSASQTSGAGTGLDGAGINHKIDVVERIYNMHQSHCGDNALEWLRCAGGFEIAALTGAYIRAAQQGLPVLVDGFISCAAALCAVRINETIADWLFFSHVSAERGHHKVMVEMGQQPLLDLGMRLGEGSGAAVAVPLMRAACALHNQMATFEEAAVAGKLR
jgi:nicotinate-nucleotide--dimethylbenzimidazole phosphoribosyltransferase